MARKYVELSVTPAVQAAQRHYYGDRARRPLATPGANADGDVDDERTPLGPEEAAFIASRDSFYLGTVSETGWPYVQHRGGPPGFLRVLDAHTLAFPDLRGNRQLLSTGNLTVSAGHDRAALFLMDYPNRTRLKVMGHARVLDVRDAPEPLVEQVVAPDPDLRAKTERVFLVEVTSFDWNCPQHITPRYTREEVETAIVAPLRARIAELEARLISSPPAPVSTGGHRSPPSLSPSHPPR